MDEVIAAIRARLDDDERIALAAYPNAWHIEETRHHEFLIVPDYFPSTPAVARTASNGEHIARWDPARVLAAVRGHRKILDEIERLDRSADVDSGPAATALLAALAEAVGIEWER